MPVDAKVAAIFLPTIPDFPIPATMTRPLLARIRRTASSNSSPMRCAISDSAWLWVVSDSIAIGTKLEEWPL